jgi:hypothetical protein
MNDAVHTRFPKMTATLDNFSKWQMTSGVNAWFSRAAMAKQNVYRWIDVTNDLAGAQAELVKVTSKNTGAEARRSIEAYVKKVNPSTAGELNREEAFLKGQVFVSGILNAFMEAATVVLRGAAYIVGGKAALQTIKGYEDTFKKERLAVALNIDTNKQADVINKQLASMSSAYYKPILNGREGIAGIFDPLDATYQDTLHKLAAQTTESAQYMVEVWSRAVDEIQAQLNSLDMQSAALDAVIRPFDVAIQRQQAKDVPFTAFLDQMERGLDRSLVPYQDAVDQASNDMTLFNASVAESEMALEQQGRALDAAGRSLDAWERQLDAVIRPLDVVIQKMEAQYTIFSIPLLRQQRVMQRALDQQSKDLDNVKKKHEEENNLLKDQIDLAQKLLDFDKEKLDVLKWETFIENTKNKILRQETSARELTLKSQTLVQQDKVDQEEEALKAMKDQLDNQQKLQALQEAAAEKQIEAAQLQIDAIQMTLDAENDKLTFAKEERELALAAQVDQRIALDDKRSALQIAQEELSVAQANIADQRTFYQNKVTMAQAAYDVERVNQSEGRKFIANSRQAMSDRMANLEDQKKIAEAMQTEDRIAIEDKKLALNAQLKIMQLMQKNAEDTATAQKKSDDDRQAAWDKFQTSLENFGTIVKTASQDALKTLQEGLTAGGLGALMAPLKYLGDFWGKLVSGLSNQAPSAPAPTGNPVSGSLNPQVPASYGSNSNTTIINNITNQGTSVNMDASYSGSPSRRSVLSDLSLAAQLIY